MTQVIWSPSALSDLAFIRGYIDQFNPRAAAYLASTLIEAGNNLQMFPYRGRSVGGGLREWTLIHPYIIRYEIVGDVVSILGVRHGKRI